MGEHFDGGGELERFDDGDLDLFMDKFFGNELIDLSTTCRGIIDVVVVGIEGAVDVEVEVDIGRFM